jgi:hypothetical protein
MGQWSARPTAALIYSNSAWFNGVLTYQLMSFAGNRAHGSVHQTYVEAGVSCNLDSGWYGDIDLQITFDWTADAANGVDNSLGCRRRQSVQPGLACRVYSLTLITF